MVINRTEITKEQYEELCKFYEELNSFSEPKKVYDKDGNVYYEIPEWE